MEDAQRSWKFLHLSREATAELVCCSFLDPFHMSRAVGSLAGLNRVSMSNTGPAYFRKWHFFENRIEIDFATESTQDDHSSKITIKTRIRKWMLRWLPLALQSS